MQVRCNDEVEAQRRRWNFYETILFRRRQDRPPSLGDDLGNPGIIDEAAESFRSRTHSENHHRRMGVGSHRPGGVHFLSEEAAHQGRGIARAINIKFSIILRR